MSAETTQFSEEKVDVTVNDGGKRKHRWYHEHEKQPDERFIKQMFP